MKRPEAHRHTGALDESALDESALAERSAWWCRLALARHGWASRTRLSDVGWGRERFGFAVWFERWDWHGVRMDRVSFGGGTGANPGLSEMEGAVLRAAALALRAWREFADSVPRVRADGGLERDRTRSAHFAPGDFPGRWSPSECLMEPERLMGEAEEDESLAERLLLTRKGIWTEDALDHLGWNPERCQEDRRWGYSLEATPERWQGEAVLPYRFSFATELLLPSVVAGLVRHAGGEIARLHEQGAWLPGMQSVAQVVLAREEEERAEEERALAEGFREEEEVRRARRARWARSRTLRSHLPEPVERDGHVACQDGGGTSTLEE